ncbi:DUF2391 family protein [Natrinema versiforme]|uniref:DUF2391 family protein n=1 Tax=Natrinema versiforme TaxID=88724 RepID=A0A4P8WLQ5_9EURY|nr:DUF2391 family protein [Natrinema versiforme]QCS44430.1 DUF2391 family protein [Natrinema versiforme]
MPRSHPFRISDFVQQIVGGLFVASPLVLTEETWRLADGMQIQHIMLTTAIVFVVGYALLYETDSQHNIGSDSDAGIGGVIPRRFVSLMLVAYLSVGLLAFAFAAPSTFEETPLETLRAVSICAIFSMIGAATADTILGQG